MAHESGGIFLSSGSIKISNASAFSQEFKSTFFNKFDPEFTAIFFICSFLIFTAIGILSLKKPSQAVSEKEISQIQERYARLVLNKPEVKIEPKEVEIAEEPVVQKEKPVKKEEEKKEEVKIDREKETFAEKKDRKERGSEKRRQVREENARKIQSAGIFAALTASGGGTGSGTTSDLLGESSIGVSKLGDLSITKGTFAEKNIDPTQLVEKKGNRTKNVGIKKDAIEKTKVTAVASNTQVNVAVKTPEISGESKSIEERSQSAIQRVVSRQSRRLKRLYEEWLKRDPALNGRLTVKFTILPSGAVSNVAIVKSTTNNNDFDNMVIRYIKRWKFSSVEGAGPVEVVYPFVFEGQS